MNKTSNFRLHFFFLSIFLLGFISLSKAQDDRLKNYYTVLAYINYEEQQYLYPESTTLAAPNFDAIDALREDPSFKDDFANYDNALANYAQSYNALQSELINADFSNQEVASQYSRLKENTLHNKQATYEAWKWQLLEDAVNYGDQATETAPLN